jgi:hypothetical protein
MTRRRWSCVLLEPTEQYARSLLRRGVVDTKCSLGGITHESERAIDVITAKGPPKAGDVWPHSDQHWPTVCDCGYLFEALDQWQVFYRRLYIRPETGQVYTVADAPIGALWYADWVPRSDRGYDGRCVVVKTPAGELFLDAKRSDGSQLTRETRPPLVSVREQLHVGKLSGGRSKWTGRLRDGLLFEVED